MVKTKLSIGERIASLRGKMSQEELAFRSGVPRRTLQNIESGETASPGIDKLEKIAHALGVTIDALRGEEPTQMDPLPDWAHQLQKRFEALELKIAAPTNPIPPEVWAAWPHAPEQVKTLCKLFLTRDLKYLKMLHLTKDTLTAARILLEALGGNPSKPRA